MRQAAIWSVVGALASTGLAMARDVTINPTIGVVVGHTTGVGYDTHGRFLFDADGVIRDGVAFNEVLTDCVRDAADVERCRDPVTGTIGVVDRARGTWRSDALNFGDARGWYDPNTGHWSDVDVFGIAANEVEAVERVDWRRLSRGWRIFDGHVPDLEAALRRALADDGPTTRHLSIDHTQHGLARTALRPKPAFPIPKHLVRLSPEHRSENRLALIPARLSARSLERRLLNYCGVQPFRPDEAAGGADRILIYRAALVRYVNRVERLAGRLNTNLGDIARREGRPYRPLRYSGARMIEGFDRMLAGMDRWYILYRGRLDSLDALAILAFRDSPDGRVMDWWPIDIRETRQHPGGWSSVAATHGASMSSASLVRLVYLARCGGAR